MRKQAQIVALLVLLSISSQQPHAQQPSPTPPTKETTPPTQAQTTPRSEQDDVLRITTSLVQIDAVVTKDGKQVTDLTPEEFEIFEDGRPQTITNFSYISTVPSTSESPPTVSAPKPAENKVAAPLAPVLPADIRRQDTRRTIAIVVDDLGISFASIPAIKQHLRKFVAEQLQPNDLVAIIRTGGEVGALQQFTTDRRLLERAIESLRWNPCGRVGTSSLAPLANVGFPNAVLGTGQNAIGLCADVQGGPLKATVRALRFILQGMRDLPGRKSMVLMSDSLPMDVPELDSLERGPIKPVVPIYDNPDDDLVRGRDETPFGQEAVLRKTAEIAIRSSVVIYAVDTRGLQITGPTATDQLTTSAPGARPRGTSYLSLQALSVTAARSAQLQNGRAGMELLTKQTGGFLVSGTNDFGLPRIVRDQEGYYLIGYRPSTETFNRSFHHIKARVKRSGLTVRTREGFYGLSDKEVLPVQMTNRDQINKALMSPFGTVQIEMRLTALFANTKKTGSIIRSLVYFKAGDLTFAREPDGSHKATFNLSGVLFGDNGAVVHETSETRTVYLSEKDYQRILVDGLIYVLDMAVKKPGAYQFRVAVRDSTSSRVGTAGQLLEVPDLRGQHLALSGVSVSGDIGPTASPRTAAVITASNRGGTEPVNNSMANPAIRRFRKGSNLYFGYILYEAHRDRAAHLPRLTTEARIFREGKLIYAGNPKPVDLNGQSDLERISVAGGLQLGGLPPGEYILQLVVNDPLAPENNRTATQLIDFEIVP